VGEVTPNNTFERTEVQRGRIVLAMDCVLAGRNGSGGRPLNWVVRPHEIARRNAYDGVNYSRIRASRLYVAIWPWRFYCEWTVVGCSQ